MFWNHKTGLYVLFSLSGYCALIYEILWTRHLSLTFGTTIYAVSIVATTFMGGLALGSYLIGRYADRESNHLRIYAFLELGIAVCALLFTPTLDIIESIYVTLKQTYPARPLLTHTLHFSFAALLLLPPTACMGGTFPLMCRFFARNKSGGQIGRLYALNTVGATLGALSAGYWLIPTLGLSLTGFLAIVGNLLIFAVSLWLSQQSAFNSDRETVATVLYRPATISTEHRVILLTSGLIGLFSLAYEILWTRVFLLFLGNTTYAFSLMLSAYLVGISAGGALYARIVRPQLDERKVFCLLTSMMGISVIVTVPFYDRLADYFLFAHKLSGERWWLLTLLSYGIVFVTLAIPTIISGALLPAAVAAINPGRAHTGEGVGLVVLHNTVGAMLGSLLAGFALIPAFGLQGSFKLLGAFTLLLALTLVMRFPLVPGMRGITLATTACGLLLAVLPTKWDQAMMNSGIYIYAPKYLKMGGLDEVLAREKIVRVIEGSETTVAIHESLDGNVRFFTVNGKTDGGTGRDMSTQILVGQLPLLLHPEPRDVLVVGLGTGITLQGLAAHPTETIECAEISPEVVEAYDYFKKSSGDPLNHPKMKLLVEDGRNVLFTSGKQYDVIVSEPSNPWQSGNANLFTDDFYRLAAGKLKSNGLFCQWVGLYDITPDNLRIMCKTLLSTFNKCMVFKSGSDLIVVAANHEILFDYQMLRDRFGNREIAQTLASIGISSPGELIAMHYLYSEEPLKSLAKGAKINSDDKPVLEFSARFNLGEHTVGEFQSANAKMLTEAGGKIFLPVTNLGSDPAAVAATLREIGKGYAKAGKTAEAETFMQKAWQVEQQTRQRELSDGEHSGQSKSRPLQAAT